MQYRQQNEDLDSCYQTVYNVTGDNGWPHLLVVAPDVVGPSIGILACSLLTVGTIKSIMLVTQCIFNKTKVYIERENLQL